MFCVFFIRLEGADENKINSDELMDYAKGFLLKPSSVWLDASLSVRTKLQWFEFPQGLTFDGEKFRTAQTCNLFKAKSTFLGVESARVDPSGIEPLTSGVQNRRSTI